MFTALSVRNRLFFEQFNTIHAHRLISAYRISLLTI